MVEFFTDYGLFLAKSVTVVFAIIALVAGIAVVSSRSRKDAKHGDIEVIHFNDELLDMKEALEDAILDKEELKALHKAEKKKEKEEKKHVRKTSSLKRKRRIASGSSCLILTAM